MCNNYTFSIETIVTRTLLNITLYVHCPSGLLLVGMLFPTVPVYSCVDNLVLLMLNPR